MSEHFTSCNTHRHQAILSLKPSCVMIIHYLMILWIVWRSCIFSSDICLRIIFEASATWSNMEGQAGNEPCFTACKYKRATKVTINKDIGNWMLKWAAQFIILVLLQSRSRLGPCESYPRVHLHKMVLPWCRIDFKAVSGLACSIQIQKTIPLAATCR